MQTFQYTLEQLPLMSARARRDIQTVVEYIATCVEKLDEDYRGKLKRVLKYLEGT